MIQTEGVYKYFGKLMALRDLTMTVNAGDIYGFIGPNGAGKSTTFKILATILKPDAGRVEVADMDIKRGDAVRSLIGYMPDSFGVYDDMTVHQYLDFFGAAYFIPADDRRRLIADILELTDLAFKRDAMVQSLSRGMQQRLGVARVLVHDPKVLILDEPASGLDPRARVELRELLKELAQMGKTIVISSHILAELSEICNRLGIIERGELIFEGTRDELNRRLLKQASIEIGVPPDDLEATRQVLKEAPFTGAVTETDGKLVLELGDGDEDDGVLPENVAAYLFEKGVRLRSFQPADMSLEKAFMVLTEGKLA